MKLNSYFEGAWLILLCLCDIPKSSYCVPLTVAVETVTTVASIESVATHCIQGRHLLPVRLKLIFAESRVNFQRRLLSKRDGEIIYFFFIIV